MRDQIPTGAYVIRNKQTSTVLHIKDAEPKIWSYVLGFEQDDNRYRDQQIWWVEPYPGCKGQSGLLSEEDVLYSITNISSGIALDLNPEWKDGKQTGMLQSVLAFETQKSLDGLTAHQAHGAPWQEWRIHRIQDEKDGHYYKLVSVWNEEVVSLRGFPALSGALCHAVPYKPGFDQHSWEFVIPVVSFPPGWFHIQNAETRDSLSHDYLCNPPVLVKAPTPTVASEYRESWGTQWCLKRAEGNTWYFINRLTGGHLSNNFNSKYPSRDIRKVGGNQWASAMKDHFWILEIDPACTSRWKIIHHTTGFLLERTLNRQDGGMGVTCAEKRFIKGDKAKTWYLTSPVVESDHDKEEPPKYEASNQAD